MQQASFKTVDAPLVGTLVLYREWRNGNEAGTISLQRIWSFRVDEMGHVRMYFYAFVDGVPWAGRANEAGAFRELNATQLRGYDAGCGLKFSLAAIFFDGSIS